MTVGPSNCLAFQYLNSCLHIAPCSVSNGNTNADTNMSRHTNINTSINANLKDNTNINTRININTSTNANINSNININNSTNANTNTNTTPIPIRALTLL